MTEQTNPSPQNSPQNMPTLAQVMSTGNTELTNITAEIESAVQALDVNMAYDWNPILKWAGYGRLRFVPTDQIHVVTGAGRHISRLDTERQIYGGGHGINVYRFNRLTSVTGMSTVTFQVPVANIEVLDSQNQAFTLDAFSQAKLNTTEPKHIFTAAETIGTDTRGLVTTIRKVTEGALKQAATQMSLEEIIKDRERLASAARESVAQHLEGIGYELILLSITGVSGKAVELWQQRALAEVTRTATIKTNAAELERLANEAEKAKQEADIDAEKRKIVDERRQAAELDVNERSHAHGLLRIEREQAADERANEASLKAVSLSEAVEQAEAAKSATIARQKSEQQAEIDAYQAQRADELRREQAERQAGIDILAAEKMAEQLDIEQQRNLERERARVAADAERLKQEETAAAQRTAEVSKIRADADANAIRTTAVAKANEMETQAKAKATAANDEAAATERLAAARIKEADATQAETAAEGLAKAEVAAREAEVALQQAKAAEAAGLAEANVQEAKAKAEAAGEQLLAELYQQYPQLVELRKLSMQHTHEEAMKQIEMDGRVKQIEYLAPGINIKAFGSPGQMQSFINLLLSINEGVDFAAAEIPALGSLFGNGISAAKNLNLGSMIEKINPRVFASMNVREAFAHAEALTSGDATAAETLAKLRKSVNMNTVGNLPVAEIAGTLFNALVHNTSETGVDGNPPAATDTAPEVVSPSSVEPTGLMDSDAETSVAKEPPAVSGKTVEAVSSSNAETTELP